jgi:dipeptidyl aminopeptidase/acylaminoacyl peptidase|uniref:Serine aminopeptidase S33 domain-containing protein n=1 Tax=Ignisphaera aggregans TaxID=334771 RepID=A0A7J2U1T1_9CREN
MPTPPSLSPGSREFWRYVDRISKPLLLIHGDQDKIIPVEASRKTFEKAKSKIKILKIYPGKGHHQSMR